jgi:asparagine synthase (glutamine-hydrolysing)
VETDLDGLRDDLTFQFCLAGKTPFKGVNELPRGQMMLARNGTVVARQYWDLSPGRIPRPNRDHTRVYF